MRNAINELMRALNDETEILKAVQGYSTYSRMSYLVTAENNNDVIIIVESFNRIHFTPPPCSNREMLCHNKHNAL